MKLSALDLPTSTPDSPAVGVLTEGSRFRAYVVGPCIGRGGMAHIYRAVHEGLQRHVALKVLTERVARDAESRGRFLREARIAASIKHPNVVNIFDVGVHEGAPYLVMELLEGEDLDRLLSAKGALDQRTIIDVMIPVVAALAAVHDAGIVHRDLKPGNIFLSRGRNNELEPKVLDFGISKALGPDEFKLTLANAPVLGTPFYLSPEALHGQEVTALSDQYSLGVLMYECATGITPFEGQTPAEVLRLISTGTYVRASTRRPELPSTLTAIIERAMSLAPEDRYPNLRQLGRDLLVLAGQRTRITWALSFACEVESAANARTRPVSAGKAASAGASRSSRWLPAHWAWLGAALVIALAASVFWWRRSEVASYPREGAALVVTPRASPRPQAVEEAAVPAGNREPLSPVRAAEQVEQAAASRPSVSRRSVANRRPAVSSASEPRSPGASVLPKITSAPSAPIPAWGPNGAPILD